MKRWKPVLVVALAGVVAGSAVLFGSLGSGDAAVASPHAGVTCGTGVQNASAGGASGIEQSVAVDPADTDNVLIGSIGSNLGSSPVVSHDCGATWYRPPGFSTCTGDQDVAFDRHGAAYFSCDGVEIYHSLDAGAHWSPPVLAASPADNMGDAIDRPWLAVDKAEDHETGPFT